MSGKGFRLEDVEAWTWDRLEKVNAMLDMEEDYTAAWREMVTPEPK